MKSDAAKTIILFCVVALVFCGLAVGGVHFIKVRNSSYAAAPGPKNDTPKQDNAPQPTSANKPASQAQPKTEESQPVAANASVQTTPATGTVAVAETGPQSMPATGAGLGDAMITITLMMLAAFFGGLLLRAKNNYRRLYSTDL